jgi:hypothetical protein
MMTLPDRKVPQPSPGVKALLVPEEFLKRTAPGSAGIGEVRRDTTPG